jgi:hypothetical protein
VELGRLVSLRTGGRGTFDLMSSRRAGYSPMASGPPVEAGEHEIAVAVTGTWELAPSGG